MSTYPFQIDDVTQARATMGLIVLKADETVEGDFRRLLPDDVTLHVGRIESDAEVTPASLLKMKDRLTRSAAMFPDAVHYTSVGYACTSGASTIGPAEIGKRVKAGCNTDHVTEPVSALVAACSALSAHRIALLSPYVAKVSDGLRATLERQGIHTSVFGSFDVADEKTVVRIDQESIVTAANQLSQGEDFDALFISCTNLRTLDAIKEIEVAIERPVLTSNQVLAWHMAKQSGMQLMHPNFGKLLA